MRDDAPRIGQTKRFNTMVGLLTLVGDFGSFSRLKNSFSATSRGARRLEALPKTCHLLPSTAIMQPQIRYTR